MSKATVHEMLSFSELIRAQSTSVQQMQAMVPLISDPDLRQEIEACISADSAQVKALVDYVKSCQTAH